MQRHWFEILEEEARRDHIPILPREGGEFLRWLVTLTKPQRVLEIGTAIGYSTLWLAMGLPPDSSLVSIEKDEGRLARAREHLSSFAPGRRVQCLLGDAGELLPGLPGHFDLVFLDGPKGQYPRYLTMLEKLTAPGSLVIADNLFLHGLATGEEKPVRYTTMAKRLQEYARRVTDSPLWDTQFLSVGDGFALSLRKDDPFETCH